MSGEVSHAPGYVLLAALTAIAGAAVTGSQGAYTSTFLFAGIGILCVLTISDAGWNVNGDGEDL